MAKPPCKLTFTFAVTRYNLDIEGTCEGHFQPGSPQTWTDPADPPEFEPESIVITHIDGKMLLCEIVLDAKGQAEFENEFGDALYQWAIDEYSKRED